MTQNTEQNVRTRDEQITDICAATSEAVQKGASHDDAAYREYINMHLIKVEARGAEEQRRKDGEGLEPRAYDHVMTYETDETNERLSYSPENAFGVAGKDYSREYPVVITPLYTRPANIAAMQAEIASLKEAEQLARADAEASKAREEKLRDAAENLIIAIGMGWDLEGVISVTHAALTCKGEQA